MHQHVLFPFVCSFLIASQLLAQSSNTAPLWDENHRIIERMEIKASHFNGIHTALRPLMRRDAYEWKRFADTTLQSTSKTQNADWQYVINDNNEFDTLAKVRKPFLKVFYRTPAHLFELKGVKHFYFNINPIIHFKAGVDRNAGTNRFVFLNRRGVAIRGNIANRVFFYTDILETQARFADYLTDRVNGESAVPGAGFYKIYNSKLTANPNDGFDYLMAQGYVGVNIIPQIGVQFGHGKHFVGDGHRSLFLSDLSNNMFYLKINTRVWRIHYQNLFAELIQDYRRAQDKVLPKKYMAAHYLSINILKNLNIGFWEATIFSRDRGFEFQYLNPIIFYRAVEQALGSPDNAMLGVSWKYNFFKRFSFYGQFVLDEFSFGDLIAKNPAEKGSWKNKYGFQAGLKYIDVAGVRGLDMQLEFNTVRPYTYTHNDSSANFTHYNQFLAHPLGANFYEWIGILRYQPIPGLQIRAQMNAALYGLDTMGSNWGKNIHISYNQREQEFGNKIAQGVRTFYLMADLWVSYRIRHNLYADLQYRFRREDAAVDALDNTSHIFTVGFRWNITEQLNDF